MAGDPRGLPARSTVNFYFCRWQHDGTLTRLHHALVVHIEGSSYRMRQHADLLPPVTPFAPHPGAQPKRRGRPPKVAVHTVGAS